VVDLLRAPDERFAALAGVPLAAHCVEGLFAAEGLRLIAAAGLDHLGVRSGSARTAQAMS
jgi:hypothetical protein